MVGHRFQTLVMPNMTFGAPEDMYVRLDNDRVVAYQGSGKLAFSKGGRATFDTFFNGVTLGLWRGRLRIEDLALVLHGQGRVLVRLGIHRLHFAQRWVHEEEVTLTEGGEVAIRLPSLEGHEDGMLFASVLARSDATVTGGHFETSTPPRVPVKLGIVVTHFNRLRYVTDAVERLRRELLNDPAYAGRVSLVVVDNFRNIPLRSEGPVTILPNENYGGSGGFTRGLMHLQDETDATHCLFMDDDASCEVESIRRTLSVLEYADSGRTAVAGALLREIEPYRLYEKGAAYANGKLRPYKTNMDMRHIEDLLEAENANQPVNYGAWWHFAFAIRDVRHYPFPFFVRGDDVLFSLQNQFDVMTVNGVACWGEDFHFKDSPLTRYLAARSEMLIALQDHGVSWRDCAIGLMKSHISALLSYNYASARAIAMGLEDVMKGPDFWTANLDGSEPRARVAAIAGPEKLRPLDEVMEPTVLPRPRVSWRFTVFRWLTLNGLLIPTFLMKNRTVYLKKHHRALLREIFGYRRVLYVYEPTKVGYLAEHDKGRMFKEMMHLVRLLSAFRRRFPDLRNSYTQATQRLTTRTFWDSVYKLRSGPAPVPNTIAVDVRDGGPEAATSTSAVSVS